VQKYQKQKQQKLKDEVDLQNAKYIDDQEAHNFKTENAQTKCMKYYYDIFNSDIKITELDTQLRVWVV
jgi:hypothetical protein